MPGYPPQVLEPMSVSGQEFSMTTKTEKRKILEHTKAELESKAVHVVCKTVDAVGETNWVGDL